MRPHSALITGEEKQNVSRDTFKPEDVQRGGVTRAADFPVEADVENLDFVGNGEQNFGIGRKVGVDGDEAVEIPLSSAAKIPILNCWPLLVLVPINIDMRHDTSSKYTTVS